MQVIVAAIPDQNVLTQVAVDPVAARTAVQFIAAQQVLGSQLCRTGRYGHGSPGVQEVDPVAAEQPLAAAPQHLAVLRPHGNG